MAGSSPTGFRDLATGFLSGFAALATAVAGVVGVLHETGYIGSRSVATPAVVAASPTMSHPAPAASASTASNSTALAMPAVAAGEAQKPLTVTHEHRQPRAHRSVSPRDEIAAVAPKSTAPEIAPPRELQPPESAKSQQPMVVLTGAWRDSGPGFCHVIKQSGDSFEIVNFAPVTGTYISVGHGTVTGRSVHLHLNDLHPAAAKGELYISDDGQKLLGTMTRPDGDHPLVWHRSGPACG
jgi:hypothetical protein